MPDKIFIFIQNEEKRQLEHLNLIPSENYASPAVRKAVGSVLMHKYGEGQVRKRYYQGNENIDEVEQECKKRALTAFGLDPKKWGVNVQALSGSPANLAAINALINPGDKILSMYLPDGGHISHGWHTHQQKITLSSKLWRTSFYRVNKKSQVFVKDEILKIAKKVKPQLIISGGTGYAREIDHQMMGEIAQEVGAYYLADIAHEAGLVAAGVNRSPFVFADVVTMTTHKTLRGPRGALIFTRRKDRLAKHEGDLSEAVDRSVFPGMQGGPHFHTMAGIAIALQEAQSQKFKKYGQQILKNAQVLADIFQQAGYQVVSGGTDKHLILLDLRGSGVFAWLAAWACEYANIILNRNTVPYETASPYYPSGLRLGTPIVTTRGMKEKEMKKIGGWIIEILKYCQKWQVPDDKVKMNLMLKRFKTIDVKKDHFLQKMRKEVKNFASQYPLFRE